MEPESQQRQTRNTTEVVVIDAPSAADSHTVVLRNICAQLENGASVVCVANPAGDGGIGILARLRDCLPGFVTELDVRSETDLAIPFAKSLALGSDETEDAILRQRWQSFAMVNQKSRVPFTVIVADADSLPESRLREIYSFLRPISGRLVLVGCKDYGAVFGPIESVPETVTPESMPARPPAGTEAETPLILRAAQTDALSHPPTVTDPVPPRDPEPVATPHPESKSVQAQHPLSNSGSPAGWLVGGLALAGLLGVVVATLPDLKELIRFDQRPVADGSVSAAAPALGRPGGSFDDTTADAATGLAPEPEPPRAPAVAETTLVPTPLTHDAAEEPVAGLPDTALTTGQIAPAQLEAEPVIGLEPGVASGVDMAALEKRPADTDGVSALTNAEDVPPEDISTDASAVRTPAPETPLPADAFTTAVQTQQPDLSPDPEQTARIVAVYLRRANDEREAGNLQQALLEVVRGLDIDPDNTELQALRLEVLAEMDALTQ